MYAMGSKSCVLKICESNGLTVKFVHCAFQRNAKNCELSLWCVANIECVREALLSNSFSHIVSLLDQHTLSGCFVFVSWMIIVLCTSLNRKVLAMFPFSSLIEHSACTPQPMKAWPRWHTKSSTGTCNGSIWLLYRCFGYLRRQWG